MHDPRNAPAHIRFHRQNITAFPLGKIGFLQHVFISTGVQNPIQLFTHALLQFLRGMGKPTQLRRGRLFDRPVRLNRGLKRPRDSLKFTCPLQALRHRHHRRGLVRMPGTIARNFVYPRQYKAAVPQLQRLEHAPLAGPLHQLARIGKRQHRSRVAALAEAQPLRRLPLTPGKHLYVIVQNHRPAPRSPQNGLCALRDTLQHLRPLQCLRGFCG